VIRTILLSGGSAWIFVKLVTVTFALIALSRLLPGPNRQVPNYRPRPLRAALRYAGGGLLAVSLAAGCAVAVEHHGRVPVSRPPTTLTVRLGTEPMSYLGVFEPAEMQSYRPIASFGSAVRHRPNIVVYYSGWLDPFQVRFAQAAFAHGATPLVQMLPKGISMAAIAAGHYDRYLRSFADQVRSYLVFVWMAPHPPRNLGRGLASRRHRVPGPGSAQRDVAVGRQPHQSPRRHGAPSRLLARSRLRQLGWHRRILLPAG
jgi:hypothetical protein